ncbi:uncharacterized protein LOC119985063 isoform X2 [Tripterygium wilfordii]|uniref:uncharacterized protein LOC119985063 isoform X2 n=1 Tax=Tripterygium wilfordii TaxID=458696 RepID=UPI0018F81344|nr:uncharacterized protein LOC119985063 isoform X2 [Tripterygium wilfordii]
MYVYIEIYIYVNRFSYCPPHGNNFAGCFFHQLGNMIQWCLCLLMLLLANNIPHSEATSRSENKIKSAVFLSPKLTFGPGVVVNKLLYNVDFPKGHIAIKSFNGELVDEAGNSVPLHETYLHHWVLERYYQLKDSANSSNVTRIQVKNSGLCEGSFLRQYFGLGSETRKTETHIPDPYGIEAGNPAEIPYGYEEIWMLNVHGIDTRGVENTLGCTECWCDLYNVTENINGQPLSPNYKGGLLCCNDGKQCRLRKNYKGAIRNLYLRYTVKWVDWDSKNIIPLNIYIFDITDTERVNNTSGIISIQHNCQIEYDVQTCNATGVARKKRCIDAKTTSLTIPTGGYLIYGVGHQHAGGAGTTLYGKHGRVLCSSLPTYGKGKEAGNEAGYIVGMSTCYPKPGSVKIADGEKLVVESNYNSTQEHIGVMGLFYILVADRIA